MNKLIWAVFENLDETCHAIEEIRKEGSTPTVISPCPRHEIDHALGEPQSRLPFISLFFGALGCFTGYSFVAWTAADWVLPVSGKPIVAIPPFTIIGFELTILFTALFTLAGMVILGFIDSIKYPLPQGAKTYSRFQRDRFGVIVACQEHDVTKLKETLEKNGAEEVHIETK